MVKVCAVVVTFNRKQLLADCIEALIGQTVELDRIIIVDNGSTDGTLDYLRSRGVFDRPSVVAISTGENLGGAGGFSRGIEQALDFKPEWCWLMDDDVVPEPDCLQRLLSAGSAHVRMPARVSEPFDNYHLPAKRFDLRTPVKRFRERRQLFSFSSADELREAECCWVEDFAFEGVMIRTETIRRVGLPRADFFINLDDYEYAFRLRYKFEERICFVPTAILRRQINTNQRASGWKRYYGIRNQIIIGILYGETFFAKYMQVIALILRIPLEAVQGNGKDVKYIIWAIFDGVRQRTVRRFVP